MTKSKCQTGFRHSSFVIRHLPILILKFPLSSSYGGGERHTLSLFHALKEHGRSFYCVTSDNVLAKEFENRQWPVQRLWIGFEPVSWWALLLFPITALFATIILLPTLLWYRIVRRTRILYCLSFTEKIIATLPARLLGMRVVWMEHTLPERWFLWNPLRLVYIFLARLVTIVTVSWAAREAFERAGVPSKHVLVIHPGIADTTGWQTSIFTTIADVKQPSIRKGQLCVGTVARLTREKGVEYLLQAIRRCRDVIPDIQCVIVGHGPERHALQWLAERLELKRNVLFVGWQQMPEKWMQHFDLFVLPSISRESFGYVALEAMAAGKPVIATTIGGVREIIEPTKTGILVEPKNPEMLAEAILNLAQHPDWRREMGERGAARVRTHFTLDRMVEQFENLLSS